jgi:hypothetical protein
MANYLFYASAPNLRRADQQNVIIAAGASQAAAQAVAEQLIGAQPGGLAAWTAISLAADVAPCIIETNHPPTGSSTSAQAIWPVLTRGGNWLLG